MELKHIDVDNIKDNHKTECELTLDLWSPEIDPRFKLFYVEDKPVGYIAYDDTGKIWSLEVFPKYRGNDYGKEILKRHIGESTQNSYTLSPISEELITYYSSLGFKETSEYEDHLSEFPIMELCL